MKRLPFDIIINNIIPYTYNVQSNVLLEDIKNYYTIKEMLMDEKYDIDIIRHEILAVFYDNNYKLSSILDRHFKMRFFKKDCNIHHYFYNHIYFNTIITKT